MTEDLPSNIQVPLEVGPWQEPCYKQRMNHLYDLGHWLATLDRPFAFLLALPFLVAAAGLVSHFLRQRSGRA
jgi:hypothetical protein